MKITIVMPVYNAEPFLSKSIGSVLEQTDSGWELVLVDDGSTDKSPEICDEYARLYENVMVVHKENGGQYEARKTGIDKATGDYIGFLDADDFLENDYVSVLNGIVKENNFPEIVCFGLNEKKQNEIKKREVNVDSYIDLSEKEGQKELLSLLCEGKITGSLCTKIFDVGLLKRINVDETNVKNKRYGEDLYHFLSIVANTKNVCLTGVCLYNYIRNDEGTSLGFERRDFSYFSTKFADKLLLDLAVMWGLDSKNVVNRIIAKNFNESIYYLLKYFRSTKDFNRKINCIKYDWSSYLLVSDINEINSNSYIRDSYKKVYKAFINKRIISIFIHEMIGW